MDIGSVIISLGNIDELNIPETYCIIDICPNLKWIFVIPNWIFDSLISWVKGRWYRPASGLLMFELKINKVLKIEITIIIFINFNLFDWKKKFIKKKIVEEIINISPTNLFKGKKKLMNNANIEIIIAPIKQLKDTLFIKFSWFDII